MTFHIPFIARRWELDGWHRVVAVPTSGILPGEAPPLDEVPLQPPADPTDGLRPVGVFGVLSL